MSFLDVNGLSMPARANSVSRSASKRGTMSRSARGVLRDPRRGSRRRWSFDLSLLDDEEGRAIERMILGEGHVWHWSDGLEAATGLSVQPGLRGRIDLTATPYPELPHAMLLDTGDPLEAMRIDPQLVDEWTIVAWTQESGTLLRRSDGIAYDGTGARDDTVLTNGGPARIYVTVADGVVTIDKNVVALSQVNALAILPYLLSESLMAELALVTTPFGPAPVLHCSGDAFEESHVWCVGQVDSVRFEQRPDGTSSPVWVPNARTITVSLFEVPDGFIGGDVLTLGAVP